MTVKQLESIKWFIVVIGISEISDQLAGYAVKMCSTIGNKHCNCFVKC